MDKRDALLGEISDEIGINVVRRDNNDIAIYTDSGVTLFDKTARTVSMTPSSALASGAAGNPVYIDGVRGDRRQRADADQLRQPRGTGDAARRDRADLSGATRRDGARPGRKLRRVGPIGRRRRRTLPGLFTWSGGPAVPATGTLSAGIAGSLKVNPAVNPGTGRQRRPAARWRHQWRCLQVQHDGGGELFDPPDRISSTASARRGPSTRLRASRRPSSLLDFGTNSVGWLEDQRQTASNTTDYQGALLTRVSTALSNAVGINLDDEYAQQLQLEQSYQASAKLITAVNAMFQTLLDAV